MSKDFRKDILLEELEYVYLSLISSKIKVLVIGAGRAGVIKTNTFLKKGCDVTVVSKTFKKEFLEFEDYYNLFLIKDKYSESYIQDKHIVIIAINDKTIEENIIADCERLGKIYVCCSNFKKGNSIVPLNDNTENIYYAINTKGGSPKTTRFLSNKIKNTVKNYDGLVSYVNILRDNIKTNNYKDEIMEFVSSDDFKYFYDKCCHIKVLNMFYGGIDFEFKNCYKKK